MFAFPPAAEAQVTVCAFDRDAMLALEQHAFDQDMKGGWRAVADRGCLVEAADLIRDYRLRHRPEHGSTESISLFWHEGQNRALFGQNDQAIALFENSRSSERGLAAWNLYVDATVFFLTQNKAGLLAARDALTKLGSSLNSVVVENLVSCFGSTYKEAYSGCKK